MKGKRSSEEQIMWILHEADTTLEWLVGELSLANRIWHDRTCLMVDSYQLWRSYICDEGEGLAWAISVQRDPSCERVLFFDYDHCSNQA